MCLKISYLNPTAPHLLFGGKTTVVVDSVFCSNTNDDMKHITHGLPEQRLRYIRSGALLY